MPSGPTVTTYSRPVIRSLGTAQSCWPSRWVRSQRGVRAGVGERAVSVMALAIRLLRLLVGDISCLATLDAFQVRHRLAVQVGPTTHHPAVAVWRCAGLA